jgi:hypothetical protein
MVVLLVAASLLSYHALQNHSMILRFEDRINVKFQAKFQALWREVHELKQQLQDQHLHPSQSLALGTALGKAMGAGNPAPPATLAPLAPLPVVSWTATEMHFGDRFQTTLAPLPVVNWTATEMHFGDKFQTMMAPLPVVNWTATEMHFGDKFQTMMAPLPVVNWTATEMHFGERFPKVLKLEPKEAIRLGKQYVAWQASLFARRGGQVWSGARSTGDKTKIERIWIWGERNSCTTIVMAILRRNFVLNCQEGMDRMNLTKCGLSECCARVHGCCSVLRLVMVV